MFCRNRLDPPIHQTVTTPGAIAGAGFPFRRSAITCAKYGQGSILRLRQVSITLASNPNALVPCSVRVPWLIRRAITQCRNARSASLLVNGRNGCASTTQNASQSLRNSPANARVLSCFDLRCCSHSCLNASSSAAYVTVSLVGLSGLVDGLHQLFQPLNDLVSKIYRFVVVGIYQCFCFADDMRPAA